MVQHRKLRFINSSKKKTNTRTVLVTKNKSMKIGSIRLRCALCHGYCWSSDYRIRFVRTDERTSKGGGGFYLAWHQKVLTRLLSIYYRLPWNRDRKGNPDDGASVFHQFGTSWKLVEWCRFLCMCSLHFGDFVVLGWADDHRLESASQLM